MTEERIKELREMVDAATGHPDDDWCHVDTLGECLDEITRLREALKFYADKDNWDDDFTPTVWDDGAVDLGNRARQALGVTGE